MARQFLVGSPCRRGNESLLILATQSTIPSGGRYVLFESFFRPNSYPTQTFGFNEYLSVPVSISLTDMYMDERIIAVAGQSMDTHAIGFIIMNHLTKETLTIRTTMKLPPESTVGIFISSSKLAVYQELEFASQLLTWSFDMIMRLMETHSGQDILLQPQHVSMHGYDKDSQSPLSRYWDCQMFQQQLGIGRSRNSDFLATCSSVLQVGAGETSLSRITYHNLDHLFKSSDAMVASERHREIHTISNYRLLRNRIGNPMIWNLSGRYVSFVESSADSAPVLKVLEFEYGPDGPVEWRIEIPPDIDLSRLHEVNFDHVWGLIILTMEDADGSMYIFHLA
jgi:hypothetical protein